MCMYVCVYVVMFVRVMFVCVRHLKKGANVSIYGTRCDNGIVSNLEISEKRNCQHTHEQRNQSAHQQDFASIVAVTTKELTNKVTNKLTFLENPYHAMDIEIP